MGNRAITYFYDGNEFSSGVYTQWNGGRHFYYAKNAIIRTNSAGASCARFAAYCCKQLPGNLSVYMYAPPTEKEKKALLEVLKDPTNKKAITTIMKHGPGDNGTYLVDVRGINKRIKVWQISDYFENRETRYDFTHLNGKKQPEYLNEPECRFIGFFKAPVDVWEEPSPKKPRTYVNSSLINSFAVSTKGNLIVEFTNGSIYRYYNVDKYTVTRFTEVESKGKYFNEHIKNAFEFTKLKQAPKSFRN